MGSQRVGHNWVTSLWLDGDVDSTAFAARILLPALRRTIFHLCGYLWGWLWILGRQSLLHSLRGCLYVFMPYMSFCPWGILLTAEWVSFCMRSYKAGIVVFPVCIFNLHNVIWYISFCFLLFFPAVNTTSLVYFHIAIGCFECVNNSPGCPSTTSYLSFFQDLSTPCYHKWCCHGYPCFSSVQFSSVAQSCLTLCYPMNCSTPGLPVHHQFPEPTQTHVHWLGDAIQSSHPLLSPSPPAFNLSSIKVFSSESALRIRWPKYWSFSFNISPSNEHPGLISFRMDWLDLLAV